MKASLQQGQSLPNGLIAINLPYMGMKGALPVSYTHLDVYKRQEDNSADDISLVLSFTDTNDERIEEAVDELQERRLHE